MSKVVRDAIEVCRILSITYLWVDSLCIIQDDSSDWATESANMAAIYANASLAISATSAAEEEAGIFGERPKPFVLRGRNDSGVPYRIHVREALSHPGFCGQFNFPDITPGIFLRHKVKEPDYSEVPLLGRAWCLQERFLSPKVLHFTSNEMILECATRFYCECMEIGRSRGDEGQLTRIRLDFQRVVATIEKEKRKGGPAHDRIAARVGAYAPGLYSPDSNNDPQPKEKTRTRMAHSGKTKIKIALSKAANHLIRPCLSPVLYSIIRSICDDKYSHPHNIATQLVEDATDVWRQIIQEYTAKALTYDRDRLPAISGVARKLGPALGSYHAGHWEKGSSSLLWYPAKATGRRNRGESRIPSWSWASVEGTPVYFEMLGEFSPWLFTVNRWDTTCTVGGDPDGAVNVGGSVEVSGNLYRAVVQERHVDDDGERFTLRGERGHTYDFTPDVVVEPAGDDVIRLGEALWCFECARHFYTSAVGLVLRKKNVRTSVSWPLSREIYWRVGHYESIHPDSHFMYGSAVTKDNEEAERGKWKWLIEEVGPLLRRSSWPYTITIV